MSISNFNAHDCVEGKDEWLTPPELIKALGEFDLDPCSPVPEKRPWDTAKQHYCIRDDGLSKEWFGRVWLNSPYGREMNRWLAKAADPPLSTMSLVKGVDQQVHHQCW